MMRAPLSQWITVDRNVARSVNLNRDAGNGRLLERFQVTDRARDVLRRLADAFEGERTNAWSLTGPYGTGKSAFCNYLMALSSGEKKIRKLCHEKLKQVDHSLAERLRILSPVENSKSPVIGVQAVSQYESLNSTLARCLASSIKGVSNYKRSQKWQELSKRVEALSGKDWPATRDVVAAYKNLAAITNKPVFIVVDEFGKNLEFQAHHPARGDIFALQVLAETEGIFLWVCLHQAFNAYSGALSQVQKEEWQKIQGRFEDHPYIEPPVRSFSLIRDALSVEPPDKSHEVALEQWAQGMIGAMSGITLNGLDELDPDTIKHLYPFHPLSVYLIGEMTRRFAQHDRTLFSFLSSGESHAFANCLHRLELNNEKRLPTLSLDMLYDYFSETSIRHADRSENQRWIEIQSMIAAHGGLDHERTKILKTVGVLNLLSILPGVEASEDMIHASLSTHFYKNKGVTTKYLHEFRRAGILLYRQYAKEYRLWEGSDFDIDLEILRARGRVALRAVDETLEEIAPQPNLVAARHSVQTGTLREFKVRWCIEDELPSLTERPHKARSSDGTLWLMLGRQKLPEGLIDIAKEGQPVIVGYAPCLEQVRELMLEAAATRAMCDAPQLERDGVARREGLHRAAQALETLSTFLKNAFTPGIGPVCWFVRGDTQVITSQRELSALVSDLCDRIYHLCPRIDNEMINVNRLTSQAAAARNRVAEALANSFVQEDLGFEGYGPEVAVYRTVIKKTGLHRKNAEGLWALCAPDGNEEPNLAAIWDLFDKLLQEGDAAGETVAVRNLLDALKDPPFGFREAPAPLLLSHYLLVRSDDIAVYEDGLFKPFFGDAEAILLMRRPELFSLRLYQPTGVRSEVIRTYCQVVNTGMELVEGARNQTILSVVVPLTQFLSNLPEYTRTTRSLHPDTLRLRNAITHMQDPQKLLFRDIPEALGFPPVESGDETGQAPPDAKELREKLWESLIELRDVFDEFVYKVQGRFRLAMAELSGREIPFDALRHDLREKTSPLVSACMDVEIKPVLGALANENGSDEEWFSQVAAIIMKKPMASWRDSDLEPFALRAGEIRERIRQLHDFKQISERNRETTNHSYFIGITTPGGAIAHKNFKTSKTLDTNVLRMLKEIEKSDRETRVAWLVQLIQSMVDKGDFK